MAELSKVELFIEELVEKYNIGTDRYGAFSLSVVEAVNNALLYGNKQEASKLITIEAWSENDVLQVSVEDQGDGFDYGHVDNPTLPENVDREKGRGLFLMEALSDNIIFDKNGAKVILSYNL